MQIEIVKNIYTVFPTDMNVLIHTLVNFETTDQWAKVTLIEETFYLNLHVIIKL